MQLKIGIIGLGTVGGTLRRWFIERTQHNIVGLDPAKGIADNLDACDAIFVCIPVPPGKGGQDLKLLKDVVRFAKMKSEHVFIRSTVLPGTNDLLGTHAAPEFLTERSAQQDMDKLDILLGDCPRELARLIFPDKPIHIMKNTEAELAKFTHNCFGALKVIYFNIIKDLSDRMNADFGHVKAGASLTGYIEPQHTQVPGPDGYLGYGGKCFPENMQALANFLTANGMHEQCSIIEDAMIINRKYRSMP